MSNKKTSPCFPMYPSDFFGDPNVRLMDGHEQAFYAIILMNMWQNAKDKEMPFLPNDDQKLAKLLKISVKDWKKVKNAIFGCLIVTDDKIESQRLSREKAKQDKYRELQSEKGKLGGRPTKTEESHGFSADNPKESTGIIPVKLPNPNPNPNPIKAISETPVDNSPAEEKPTDEKDAVLKELKETMIEASQQYNSIQEQTEIINFVKSNIATRNPKAITHVLKSLIKNKGTVEKITPWVNAALLTHKGGENQKYNAADYQKAAEEFKKPGIFSIGDIFKGIQLRSQPAAAH